MAYVLLVRGSKGRMKLEIAKMLVLSTRHLTQATANKLPQGHADLAYFESQRLATSSGRTKSLGPDEEPDWWPTFARDEGWVFHVGDPHDEDTPKDLTLLLAFAQRQGVDWLMLDRDGPVVEELPHYEW